ncbi:uncharacterized protein LOC134805143 [Cydia splendana]|uniref:uncharacterized protein LOC134805143 n=1 Tax=Cydia splendana TaxID=1100963 RepID=UPI0021213618
MWRWAALWQASTLLLVGATINIGFFTRSRHFLPPPQVNCLELPNYSADTLARTFNTGRRLPREVGPMFVPPTTATFLSRPLIHINEMSPRIDQLLPEADDIVKEHAKLVQDINSLKQLVFVSPFADENRDYEDSIFHEIIETTTLLPRTKATTTTKSPPKTTKASSIPIVLLGGASNQRQVVKSQPIKFPKTSINLVGTSVSPLLKHPYPFVMQETSRRPLKVCMSTMPTMYATPRPPTLWERLLRSIIPR